METRLHARGAEELCVLEQWCEPGAGAPTHTHFEVEEAIVVVEGAAEFWVDDSTELVEAGASIVLPAHSRHGFRNAGDSELHTLAVFASAHPRVEYDDDPGNVLEIAVKHEGHR